MDIFWAQSYGSTNVVWDWNGDSFLEGMKRLEGKRKKLEKKEKEGKRQRRDAEFAEERRGKETKEKERRERKGKVERAA
jgi:hypothetical protein